MDPVGYPPELRQHWEPCPGRAALLGASSPGTPRWGLVAAAQDALAGAAGSDLGATGRRSWSVPEGAALPVVAPGGHLRPEEASSAHPATQCQGRAVAPPRRRKGEPLFYRRR
jgi:hypothetical protein